MGAFDGIKKLVGIEEIDEDEEEVVEEKKEELRPLTPPDARERIEARRPTLPESSRPSSNTGKFTNQIRVNIVEPQDFNDCPKLVDTLKAKKPVIINLESAETDVARKIFDFLSGATYALNGNVQKIANNIFIFAPENVDVSYNSNQKQQEPTTYKSPWK